VAACGATRVMPAMSATQVREEATQPVEATREATYLAMWADMRAQAVQGMLVHEKVAQVLSMSATQVHEEAARPAEAVRTATHSQTGRDIPVAKEDSHYALLAAMKQRLPSLAARLRRLWQDAGMY
jgi:hypothetical protein